jgi:endonuclease/exonuclease/phosphatase family metal-dependent hydrolase
MHSRYTSPQQRIVALTRMSSHQDSLRSFLFFTLVLYSKLAFGVDPPCWVNQIKSIPVDPALLKEELKAHRSDPGIVTQKERFNYYAPSDLAQNTVPLKVMTWNVERAGPDLFLPKNEWYRYDKKPDWYNRLWNQKLQMIAKVLLLQEPDVIFFNEVSWAGRQELIEAVLRPLGYTNFFFDAAGKTSFNGMGNFVATKSKYPIIDVVHDAPQTYGLEINDMRPDTRNIVRWQIAVGNKLVTFLGVHFRSRIPFSTEEVGLRDWKAHHIREQQVLLLKEKIRTFQDNEAIVVLGDFNGALPGSRELEHTFKVKSKAFLNMESEEDNRRSMRELTTASTPTKARIRKLPHDPFRDMDEPTYVYKQFFTRPGTSDADGDGVRRSKYLPPNVYRFQTDHILILPGRHHVIEASENPTIAGPSFTRDPWGNPKNSTYRISEERLDDYFGPSDHFAKVVTLHINADEE